MERTSPDEPVSGSPASQKGTMWMDRILHHFETMGNHCLLEFAGKSPGGAGFRPSTEGDGLNRGHSSSFPAESQEEKEAEHLML